MVKQKKCAHTFVLASMVVRGAKAEGRGRSAAAHSFLLSFKRGARVRKRVKIVRRGDARHVVKKIERPRRSGIFIFSHTRVVNSFVWFTNQGKIVFWDLAKTLWKKHFFWLSRPIFFSKVWIKIKAKFPICFHSCLLNVSVSYLYFFSHKIEALSIF